MSGFTLDELRRALESERRERDLTDLPESFYRDARAYLSRLLSEAEQSSGIRREILTAEIEGVAGALRELHVIRRTKALSILSSGRTPVVSAEENEGFEEIKKLLQEMEGGLVQQAGERRPRPQRAQGPKRAMCVFLADLPERIVGEDRKSYGPFRKGDVANLPEKNAELLTRHGVAARLEVTL
ncbi:MAG: hypothetical protein QW567_04090 [Candidatus Hadarchaeales archaeon]